MLNTSKKLYASCKVKNIANLLQYRNAAAAASDTTAPTKTALYDFHVQQGGKIVNFGGYALPVQYADQGIVASHLHTRKVGSIFDVSHMLQTYVRGKDAIACIESICTADIRGAANNAASLTVFTSEHGGILDDLIVTKISNELLYIVSNAAMREQDMSIMSNSVTNYKAKGKDVSIEFLPTSEQSLIAVQGPHVAETLKKFLPSSTDLNQLYFMHTTVSEVAGVSNCRITRCGYTGEDGFEISVASDKVKQVTEAILETSQQLKHTDGSIKLAGLGARDSLRIEAGLCLYGTDIDEKTTPIEAGLTWLVAKQRRAEQNFPGSHVLSYELKNGVKRRRVGIKMLGSNKPPARHGALIYHDEKLVGEITSGCPSPSLGMNVAMGYIAEQLKGNGTAVQLKIRDKFYSAEVTKMPFVKSNYYTKPKIK